MTFSGLRAALATRGDADAVVFRDEVFSAARLAETWCAAAALLEDEGVEPGAVVVVEGDHSPVSMALLCALAGRGCIVVPLTDAVADRDRRAVIAGAEIVARVDDEVIGLRRTGRTASHELHAELRRRGRPGLVVFTSGSSGEPKAAVHDLATLLARHGGASRAYRAISFLVFDHIGGINTMLRMLATGGCMVCVERRDPDAVLAAVARHEVELLPVSPTFLNLMFLGGAHERHDLSSLRVVSFGTEPMPKSTLSRLRTALPGVRPVQLYGLSEVGILPSRTRSDDPSWIRLGGDGAAVRVRDGLLEVRADTAMLGYLNAPSPFTDDGWLRTGDAVETEGCWMRIRGRASELINVGGEKVFPAEVESVLLEMEDVDDVVVHGVSSPIVGEMVCARVTVGSRVDPRDFRRAARALCAARLEPFKVPVKFELLHRPLHSERFKRVRSPFPCR